VVFLLVLLVAVFFGALKHKAGENLSKYPPTMNCDGIYSLFGSKINKTNVILTKFTSNQTKMFEQYAKLDKNLTLNKLGGGFYQCFCMKFPNSKECHDYNFDKNLGTALNFAVCGLVNIINYALQLCVQSLAASVGYDTLSE
jgi:hypothetical protein